MKRWNYKPSVPSSGALIFFYYIKSRKYLHSLSGDSGKKKGRVTWNRLWIPEISTYREVHSNSAKRLQHLEVLEVFGLGFLLLFIQLILHSYCEMWNFWKKKIVFGQLEIFNVGQKMSGLGFPFWRPNWQSLSCSCSHVCSRCTNNVQLHNIHL